MRRAFDKSAIKSHRMLVAGRFLLAVFACLLFAHGAARAATYTSASTVFAWIDPSGHTKVGYNTAPYKFNNIGCGTTPPVLDDTISDAIPIGFNFTFGGTSYASAYVQTNGRLQFGNTTCGFGTASVGPPQTYPYGYPDGAMNATMKVFGVDLDPTSLADLPNYPTAGNTTSCLNIASCYVSIATIGVAPTRQFVVTWKDVPEWVTASNTSGKFELQIILNENGTFLYQYGAITHGGTGTAQVGWQLGGGDFDVLSFGASTEPPPNTAILFYVPSAAPLAEYRFEEGAWAPGGVGQVADSSGNGRPGQATGSTQTTSAGKVCRGASIPANSSAAVVDSIKTGVRFSDAAVNMQGQGTVTFWYQSNVAWNGSAAAQLLDATQLNGQWFSLTRTAAGTLFFEVTDSTGTVHSVETAAQSFAAGTWVHLAVSWNFNALAAANRDHISVFIDGAAPTTASFTTTGSLIGSLDYLSVGDNPSGFTGTKGSVNSANGTVDELRIYNLELNQGQIGGIGTQTHGCATFVIDHLELRNATWSGISCAPSSMTVAACSDAACSVPYTSGLIATLSSTGAATIWDSAAGGATVIIGAGQSSTSRNFFTAAGSAAMGIAGTGVPVVENNPKKCNGPGNSCNWSSANGGLLLTVPNAGVITGGKPVAVSVQAVQSSGPTPGAACVPVQNLSGAGLKAWSAPGSPASFAGTSSSAGVTVGGTPQVANAAGGSYTSTPLSRPGSDNVTGLTFDDTATTTLWLKHVDTGQFQLNATLDTAATSTTPALSLAGVGLVTSVPVGYGVAAASVRAPAAVQTACAGGGSAACDAAAGSSVRVGSAGVTTFSTTITAALWTVDLDSDLTDNPVAPSYAGALSLSPLIAAPVGGSAGALASAAITLVAGTNTASQSWTQSGAMRITASGTYLSQTVSGQSAVLGRFSPRGFTTTATTQGCGAFTYSGQPISVVTVRALDGAPVPAQTPNYGGAFARAVTLSDGNASGAGSFASNVIAAASFSGGAATGAPVFTFTAAKTAPLSLLLRAGDGEAGSSGFSEANAPIRSGRLSLQNAYGSELLPLPVPLFAQYWNGSNYTTNTADSCTVLPASSIVMNNYLNQLNACETQLSPSGNLAIVAGKLAGAGLVLSKPGLGNSGSVNLSINVSATATGSTCIGATQSAASAANLPWFGPNIGARASFGLFKSPIIYGRENY